MRTATLTRLPARPFGRHLLAALAVSGALSLAMVGAAGACAVDADCDDGIACNGAETCNPDTLTCDPGTPSPDTDGDGVCDAVDNCPLLANPTQQDTNLNAIGDACELHVTRAKLRRKSTGPGDKSAMRADAFLVVGAPLDLSAGVEFRVTDALTVDQTRGFGPGECVSLSTKTLCRGAEGGRSAVFKPLYSTPNVLRFSFVFKRLGLVGAFNGPITITMTNLATGEEWTGAITDCLINLTGIRCRQ